MSKQLKKVILISMIFLVSCSKWSAENEHDRAAFCPPLIITGKWTYLSFKPAGGVWQPLSGIPITVNDSTMSCWTGIHIHPYENLFCNQFTIEGCPYQIDIFNDTMYMVNGSTFTEYKLLRTWPTFTIHCFL